MEFPRRIYTEDEVRKAKELVDAGHKHHLRVGGSSRFKQKARKAIELIKVAGSHDFFRTYIRTVKEIDGLTQLRQVEATIWTNEYAVENPVDAASVFFQKANGMKEYLEGKLYFGGEAEKRSVEKRKDFLKALATASQEKDVVRECERLLRLWKESSLVY